MGRIEGLPPPACGGSGGGAPPLLYPPPPPPPPLWNAGFAVAARRLETAIPVIPAVATAAIVDTAMMPATAAAGIADEGAAEEGSAPIPPPAADASDGSRKVVGFSGLFSVVGAAAAGAAVEYLSSGAAT